MLDRIVSILANACRHFSLTMKWAVYDITLFPSRKLLFPILIALGVTVVSLLSRLLGLPTFIEWKGSLLGTALLAVLYQFSEKEAVYDDEYRSVIASVEDKDDSESWESGAIDEDAYKDAAAAVEHLGDEL